MKKHVVICGSMSCSEEMVNVQRDLENATPLITCTIPTGCDDYIAGRIQRVGGSEGAKRKIEHDFIREYFNTIRFADAILVVNAPKNGVVGYIGGNAFLEMGFAHVLRKKLFLLYGIPNTWLIQQEIEAMQPTLLYGNPENILRFLFPY